MWIREQCSRPPIGNVYPPIQQQGKVYDPLLFYCFVHIINVNIAGGVPARS